jgi:hypothetical protein
MLHNTLLLLLTFTIRSVSVTGTLALAIVDVKIILLPSPAIVGTNVDTIALRVGILVVVASRRTNRGTNRRNRARRRTGSLTQSHSRLFRTITSLNVEVVVRFARRFVIAINV